MLLMIFIYSIITSKSQNVEIEKKKLITIQAIKRAREFKNANARKMQSLPVLSLLVLVAITTSDPIHQGLGPISWYENGVILGRALH